MKSRIFIALWAALSAIIIIGCSTDLTISDPDSGTTDTDTDTDADTDTDTDADTDADTDTDTDTDADCPPDQILCGTMCVNPLTDNEYCGATGNCTGGNAGEDCDPGYICDGTGECALNCQAGFINCEGVCIDPLTNEEYCGASADCTPDLTDGGADGGGAGTAGETCGLEYDCVAGACVLPCAGCTIASVCYSDGQLNPLNICEHCDVALDTADWSDNDGAACDDGLFCTVDDVCGSGSCAGTTFTCDDGIACNGTESCNDTTDACVAGTATCTAGYLCNTTTDTCVLSCVGGTTQCGTSCVNTAVDPGNCGGCANVPSSGDHICQPMSDSQAVCISSTCDWLCDAGYTDCPGGSVPDYCSALDDWNDCGDCGITCDIDNDCSGAPLSCVDCVPSVSTMSSPPYIPSGLKTSCQVSPCPVLLCGQITYWFFSYIDNRTSFAVTGFDPSGTVVKGPTEKSGARYITSIFVNSTAQTVTAVGQAANSITMNWSELRLP